MPGRTRTRSTRRGRPGAHAGGPGQPGVRQHAIDVRVTFGAVSVSLAQLRGPVVHVAGDRATGVSYLMGNNTVMARVFRHEPAILLYAPLHLVI